MWKARLLRGLAVTLPIVALYAWADRILVTALEAQTAQRTTQAAVQLGRELTAQHRALERELDQLCRFDQRSERLLLEVQSGLPRADARRSLQAMRRTTKLDELGLFERRSHAPVAYVPRRPTPALTRGGTSSLQGGALWLHASCELGARHTLHASREARVPEEPHEGLELRVVAASDAPSSGDWQLCWPTDPAAEASVWVRASTPGRPRAALQVGGALALIVALGFAWFTRRRGEVLDEAAQSTALTAIERAAERVAQGDLVSHIGVRTGTEADRTLTAFDRMTEELRATREKLVRAERAAAWQDMARRIAHEIKNPLSPIRTAVETLRKAHARRLPDFDEIFAESSQAILEEVQRLSHIVREFSEFARLPKPQPGALDVRSTSEHAVNLVKHGEVPVTLEAADPLPSVRADREQLTQVLINLLQNACTAASHARAEDARVKLTLTHLDGHVRLAVHDNGPGVPEAQRARLFEPYYTQTPGGTGLGLAIAARIVEEHGSSLRIEDSPLGGAAFVFELSVESAASTRPL